MWKETVRGNNKRQDTQHYTQGSQFNHSVRNTGHHTRSQSQICLYNFRNNKDNGMKFYKDLTCFMCNMIASQRIIVMQSYSVSDSVRTRRHIYT